MRGSATTSSCRAVWRKGAVHPNTKARRGEAAGAGKCRTRNECTRRLAKLFCESYLDPAIACVAEDSKASDSDKRKIS